MQAQYAHKVARLFTLKNSVLIMLTALALVAGIFYAQKVSAATAVRISWSTQNVSNCRVPYGDQWNWTGALSSSGGSVDIPRSNFTAPGTNWYNFAIACDGVQTDGVTPAVWTETASIMITNPTPKVTLAATQDTRNINPLATINFYSDSYYLESSQGTNIRWTFSDSNGSCTAGGAWSGAVAPSGTSYVSRSLDTQGVTKTYTLDCRTSSGANAQQAGFNITFAPYVPYVGGSGGCFTQGTMVTMANGDKKDIALVKPGELIMSSYGPEEVKKKYEIDYTGDLYAFNGSDNYFVTPTHPFMTTEGWKSFNPEGSKKETPGLEVTKLSVGDTLVLKDGNLQKLEKIDVKQGHTTVYNFGVNGSHDFYADNYQVHNVNLGVFIPKVEAIMINSKD